MHSERGSVTLCGVREKHTDAHHVFQPGTLISIIITIIIIILCNR